MGLSHGWSHIIFQNICLFLCNSQGQRISVVVNCFLKLKGIVLTQWKSKKVIYDSFFPTWQNLKRNKNKVLWHLWASKTLTIYKISASKWPMAKLTASLKADINCQDREKSYDLLRRIQVSVAEGGDIFDNSNIKGIALSEDQLVFWNMPKLKWNDWLASGLFFFLTPSSLWNSMGQKWKR